MPRAASWIAFATVPFVVGSTPRPASDPSSSRLTIGPSARKFVIDQFASDDAAVAGEAAASKMAVAPTLTSKAALWVLLSKREAVAVAAQRSEILSTLFIAGPADR